MSISLEQAEELFKAFDQELIRMDALHSSSCRVFDAAYVIRARNSLVYQVELIAKFNDPSLGRGFATRSVELKDDQLSLTSEACAHIAQHLAFKLLGVKL